MDHPYVDSPIECGLAELGDRSSWGLEPPVMRFDLHEARLALRIITTPEAGSEDACAITAQDGVDGDPIEDGPGAEPAPTDPSEATDPVEPSDPSDPSDPSEATIADPVARVRELARQRSALEAQLLGAARDLSAEVGRALLSDKGFADVEELTSAQRRRWRAETKRLACAELQVALGLGVKEARQMIGVACAPAPVRTVVGEALATGLASWGHVRAFWDRCGSLEADEAVLVCESLFGSDADTVVTERLGPDGTVLDRPWHQAEFWAALEREAVRVEGQDVVAERERRRRARADRHVWMRVDDDSTATLAITGPLTSLCAISRRLDLCAKALRKGGDGRTLAQLRSDVAQTLLLHGHLDLPDPQDALVSPTHGETVAQIVTAQPSICLEVVVPWDALSGHPACARCPAGDDPPGTQPTLGHPAGAGVDRPAGDAEAPEQAPPDRPAARLAPPDPAAAGRAMSPPAAAPARPPSLVGEVLGRHPAFITAGHARELALAPGTTLTRLLVDPADGRLIERSITSYRPDAAMRRQVVAADVYSRAPGSRSPALACELDHEQPWGSGGGATSESNLVLKDVRSHQLKTEGWWSSALGPRRDVRWETLLGQVEQTRGHDYRQYLPSRQAPSHPDGPDLPGPREQPGLDLPGDDDLDLACRALYAALAHRGVAALLADADDAEGATDHDPRLSGWITLAHRGQDGRRRSGPPEDCATVASLLRMTSRTGPDDDAPADALDGSQDQEPQSPPPAADGPRIGRQDGPRGQGPRDQSHPMPDEGSEDPPASWETSRDDPPPF
ncbi:hypothetical protein [uncultured Serinicoccus sp.]|uniref:hypothetical protein n=1 Tax=uncultured Serinicoccus sp. TaxID=735514 RepID=UPI0026302A57|nr:hypothetical protein [uncultured Serinicoccus sp.]